MFAQIMPQSFSLEPDWSRNAGMQSPVGLPLGPDVSKFTLATHRGPLSSGPRPAPLPQGAAARDGARRRARLVSSGRVSPRATRGTAASRRIAPCHAMPRHVMPRRATSRRLAWPGLAWPGLADSCFVERWNSSGQREAQISRPRNSYCANSYSASRVHLTCSSQMLCVKACSCICCARPSVPHPLSPYPGITVRRALRPVSPPRSCIVGAQTLARTSCPKGWKSSK